MLFPVVELRAYTHVLNLVQCLFNYLNVMLCTSTLFAHIFPHQHGIYFALHSIFYQFVCAFCTVIFYFDLFYTFLILLFWIVILYNLFRLWHIFNKFVFLYWFRKTIIFIIFIGIMFNGINIKLVFRWIVERF